LENTYKQKKNQNGRGKVRVGVERKNERRKEQPQICFVTTQGKVLARSALSPQKN
jgi:hypothetical protein